MQPIVINRKLPSFLVGLGIVSSGFVLGIAALVGVPLRSASASTPPILVKMVDMPATFQPAKLSIRVGDTVEWKNIGNSVHHASSDPSTAVNPAEVSNPPGT